MSTYLKYPNTGGGGSGTVTSVSLSLPADFTVSGSPVTGAGTLSAVYASQAQNLVLASPNGSSGVPTFRALVSGDLPGGMGSVTSVGLAAPAFLTVSGSPVTTSGTLTLTLANQGTNLVLAGPPSGGAVAPTFRALVAADLPAGTGTVTSVALTVPAFMAVSGSPITTSGTLAVTISSQAQNLFLASPNGSSGTPSFRAIVAADVPTLNQNTTGTSSNVTGTVAIANGGTGQTTANPAFNALSPLTTKGDVLSYSTVNARLGVGSDGQVLTADSTQTLGVKWAATGGANTALSNLTTTNINQSLIPNPATAPNYLGFTTSFWNSTFFTDCQSTDYHLIDAASTRQGDFNYNPGAITLPSGQVVDIGLQTFAGNKFGIFTNNNGTNNSTATDLINIETGNKTAGTGNSGAITIKTGTSSGGTRGNINLNSPTVAITGALTISTALAIAQGGTGQTTKTAAFDALQPMTTGGDIIYGGASGTGTRLANGSSGQFLKSNGGTSAPTWAAPTVSFTAPTFQYFVSGTTSGTYTTPANVLYIRIRIVGAGAGGTGSGSSGAGNSTAGGDSTFGSGGTLLTAHGAGLAAAGANNGGAGGSTSVVGSFVGVWKQTGSYGGCGSDQASSGARITSGYGGTSPFGFTETGSFGALGGGGPPVGGGGGAGGGCNASAGNVTGHGGGAGGYIEAILVSPGASYPYTIGAGGTGGSAGTNGQAGGNGGDGFLLIDEYYQ